VDAEQRDPQWTLQDQAQTDEHAEGSLHHLGVNAVLPGEHQEADKETVLLEEGSQPRSSERRTVVSAAWRIPRAPQELHVCIHEDDVRDANCRVARAEEADRSGVLLESGPLDLDDEPVARCDAAPVNAVTTLAP